MKAKMTIKEMRLAAGLTQEQLLERCPFPYMRKSLLSEIENGHVLPAAEFMTWAEQICGVSASFAADSRREANLKIDRESMYGKILETLSKAPDGLTARQTAEAIGLTTRQSVAPRLTELTMAGLTVIIGRRTDNITNVKVSVYRRADECLQQSS